MSSAKDKLKKDKEKKQSWLKTIKSYSFNIFSVGKYATSVLYSYSRHIGWFIITTGIVTALPLLLEVYSIICFFSSS